MANIYIVKNKLCPCLVIVIFKVTKIMATNNILLYIEGKWNHIHKFSFIGTVKFVQKIISVEMDCAK